MISVQWEKSRENFEKIGPFLQTYGKISQNEHFFSKRRIIRRFEKHSAHFEKINHNFGEMDRFFSQFFVHKYTNPPGSIPARKMVKYDITCFFYKT